MITPSPSAEIYLIRHAESALNTTPNIVAGRSNETPLTPEGIEQSKRLGLYLLDHDIIPTDVFSSPAKRAQQTAAFALGEMGISISPTLSDGLQEQTQGKAEGLTRVDVYTPAVRLEIDRLGKDFKLPGGESMNDVGTRLHNWVQEAVEAAAVDRDLNKPLTLYGFSHGGAIANLASRILGWKQPETYKEQGEIANASISRFVLDQDSVSVDYLGRPTS